MSNADKIFDLYKPLRNQFRELNIRDTFYYIWAIENNLQFHKPLPDSIPKSSKYAVHGDVQARRISSSPEWELEFILAESIINSDTTGSRSILDYNHLRRLINGIRTFEDEISKFSISNNPKTFQEFFRMSHRQFEWQYGTDLYLAYRYFRMHTQPELEPIFTKVFGLTPLQFYTLTYAISGTFKEQFLVSPTIKPALPGITDVMVDAFVKRYSKKLETLQQEIRESKTYDERLFYSYNAFRSTPIIEIGGQLCCPLKVLLLWQATRGIFYTLIKEQDYPNAIGKAFEEYTGYIISKANTPNSFDAQPEIVYNNGMNRSSDWIIEDANGLVFCECKAKRISMAGKIELDIAVGLHNDIRTIAGYVVKMYKTYLDYKNGLYTNFPFRANKPVYLQMISLEDWYFIGPEIDKSIKDEVIAQLNAANLDPNLIDEAPYHFTSIAQFENNIQVLHAVGVEQFYKALIANTLDEEKSKVKGRILVKDDLNADFLSKLGINI